MYPPQFAVEIGPFRDEMRRGLVLRRGLRKRAWAETKQLPSWTSEDGILGGAGGWMVGGGAPKLRVEPPASLLPRPVGRSSSPVRSPHGPPKPQFRARQATAPPESYSRLGGTRPGNPQAATASATPREDNSTSTRHHHSTAPSTPRRGDDDDDDGTAPTPSGRTHTATLSPSHSSNGDRTAGPVQSPARVADCRPPLSSVAATPPPPRLAHHGRLLLLHL